MDPDQPNFHIQPAPDKAAETMRLNKLGAEHEVNYLIKARDVNFEQYGAMSRWLLASVLAINGAGALATINATDRVLSPALPASCFVTGMMLTLIAGLVYQHQHFMAIKPTLESLGYWAAVSGDGVRILAKEKELQAKSVTTGGHKLIPVIIAFLAVVAFLCGAYSLAEARRAAGPPPPPQVGSDGRPQPAPRKTADMAGGAPAAGEASN